VRRGGIIAAITVLLVALAIPVWATVAGKTNARTLTAVLTGDAEVPANDSGGAGLAEVAIDVRRGVLCFELTASGVVPQEPAPGAGAAHIHTGSAGNNGSIVVGFGPGVDDFTTGCLGDVDQSLLRDLVKNPRDYYVNVHSADFPGGEIRGQLSR
jgi:hypothetical protein